MYGKRVLTLGRVDEPGEAPKHGGNGLRGMVDEGWRMRVESGWMNGVCVRVRVLIDLRRVDRCAALRAYGILIEPCRPAVMAARVPAWRRPRLGRYIRADRA